MKKIDRKRLFAIVLTITVFLSLSACSSDAGKAKLLDKEGVAPYELSKSDTYLLQSLSLENAVTIISFKAPKTAGSLKAEVYALDDNGIWNVIGGGQVLMGQEDFPDARLEGTFAMLLKDNFAIDMHINTTMGRASYQIGTLDIYHEMMASSKVFLTDFQEIELNKEIPVAIMIYDSGTSMRSYSTESFFTPSDFEGMDLVQAITLSFSDEII